MPIIKSAIKRARQATKRRNHNLVVRQAVKKDIRSLTDALASGDSKAVAKTFAAATSEIDRAVKKGTLHRNTASRKKSRLSGLIKRTLAEPAKVDKAKPKPAAKKTTAKPAAKRAPAKKPAKKAA